MMKTIKQIAEELGVTKQAVHQKRKSKELSTALQPFTSTVDGVVYISVDGEKLIKQAFGGIECKQECKPFTSTVYGLFTPETPLYEILKNELDIKNKEIEQLREDNKRLSEQLIVLSDKVGTTLQSITQTQLADKIIEGKKMIEESKKPWWRFKRR